MKIGVVALAVVSADSALGVFRVPDIAIERAFGGQTVHVRFESVEARLIELRVNGMSVGTRAVNGTLVSSTSFLVEQAVLNEGSNLVEALIFDKDGKLLSREVSNVEVEAPTDSPVVIMAPKAGQTVMGLLEIRVDVNRDVRPKMVTFIVNGETRSMTNIAPYTYVVDTEMLPNGWHEVQVLVIDDYSLSHRSRKVRVFVNNPGGRTERVMPIVRPVPPVPPVVPVVTSPTVPMSTMSGTYSALTAKSSGTKPMKVASPAPTVTGARSLTPTGKRVVAPKVAPTVVSKPVATPVSNPTVKPVATPVVKPVAAPTVRPVAVPVAKPTLKPALKPLPAPVAKPVVAKIPPVQQTAAAVQTVRVTQGVRLNLTTPLKLTYNSRPVNFDVQPRVTNGIALSPFRHLYEAAGGKVKWEHDSKSVLANGAATEAKIHIGSARAFLNGQSTTLEYAAFIDRGRTIVPLSFISDVLKVNVDVDPKTGHVLITAKK